MGTNRVARKDAVSVGDALKILLKGSKLLPQHNSYRIGEAWNEASGAAKYTMKRFYRDRKLFITLSSSAVRSQLSFQKDALIERMNSLLAEDELYIQDGDAPVKELILK